MCRYVHICICLFMYISLCAYIDIIVYTCLYEKNNIMYVCVYMSIRKLLSDSCEYNNHCVCNFILNCTCTMHVKRTRNPNRFYPSRVAILAHTRILTGFLHLFLVPFSELGLLLLSFLRWHNFVYVHFDDLSTIVISYFFYYVCMLYFICYMGKLCMYVSFVHTSS